MRANVEGTHGVLLAEAASMALRPHIGSEAAKAVVREACQTAIAERRHMIDVLRAKTTAPIDWDALREEGNYLGSTGAFIDAVLAAASAITSGAKASLR
jgi:3-carboxy-cis,cis-muconate cycloisomerase